mgnify:CR=1 FL=1
MPKNKTHSGTKKRIKVTGSGKLTHAGSGKRHNLEKKSTKKKAEESAEGEEKPKKAPAKKAAKKEAAGTEKPAADAAAK